MPTHLQSVPRRISIPSLRMEGDQSIAINSDYKENISIHSLRMEGDP